MRTILLGICLAVFTSVSMRANDSITPPDYSRFILTPKASETPHINGPKVYGARPGADFLYRIPTTGRRPITFSAQGLPKGLKLDPKSGIIRGP